MMNNHYIQDVYINRPIMLDLRTEATGRMSHRGKIASRFTKTKALAASRRAFEASKKVVTGRRKHFQDDSVSMGVANESNKQLAHQYHIDVGLVGQTVAPTIWQELIFPASRSIELPNDEKPVVFVHPGFLHDARLMPTAKIQQP